jgi:hypothetical protein
MDDSSYRLIYISRNKIQGEAQQVHQEVAHILDVARQRNSEAGITGALMFNSGCFAQVLEGSLSAIEETFERIQCDSRHAEVVVLSFEPVDSRSFDSWSMAYVGANSDSIEEFDTFRAESGFDPDNIPGNRIFEIIKEHLLDAEDDTPNLSAAA